MNYFEIHPSLCWFWFLQLTLHHLVPICSLKLSHWLSHFSRLIPDCWKISWFTTLNALYWVCSTCFFKAYVQLLPAFLFRFGSDPTNQLNSLDDLHSYNHPLYFSVLPSIFGHLAHPLLCKHFLHIKIARPGCAFGTLYLIFLGVFYEQSTCTLSYAKGYFFFPSLLRQRMCFYLKKVAPRK